MSKERRKKGNNKDTDCQIVYSEKKKKTTPTSMSGTTTEISKTYIPFGLKSGNCFHLKKVN